METQPPQQYLVTAQDARRVEQLTKYQISLELYRLVLRDSMSEEFEPNPKYLEELKSYVISMYVDLRHDIQARPDYASKFSKLDAILESDKPDLNEHEVKHFFLLIREVLSTLGIT